MSVSRGRLPRPLTQVADHDCVGLLSLGGGLPNGHRENCPSDLVGWRRRLYSDAKGAKGGSGCFAPLPAPYVAGIGLGERFATWVDWLGVVDAICRHLHAACCCHPSSPHLPPRDVAAIRLAQVDLPRQSAGDRRRGADDVLSPYRGRLLRGSGNASCTCGRSTGDLTPPLRPTFNASRWRDVRKSVVGCRE